MGMLLRRYYDETYATPVENKNVGVAEKAAPIIPKSKQDIAEPEKETENEKETLADLTLVELRKLGKEQGIPKAHLKGKAELCELLKDLV